MMQQLPTEKRSTVDLKCSYTVKFDYQNAKKKLQLLEDFVPRPYRGFDPGPPPVPFSFFVDLPSLMHGCCKDDDIAELSYYTFSSTYFNSLIFLH